MKFPVFFLGAPRSQGHNRFRTPQVVVNQPRVRRASDEGKLTRLGRWLVKFFASIALLMMISGCASLRALIMGEGGGPNDRIPAGVADNTTNGEQEVLKAVNSLPEYEGNPVGPDLQKNEFAQATRTYNERSQLGFRRKADPWDGASGGTNENSLWDPESQDNYLFTRNLKYKVGDFVILTVEPDLSESLNNRLESIYTPKRKSTKTVVAEEAGKVAGAKVEQELGKQIKNDAINRSVAQDVADSVQNSLQSKSRYFTSREVPLRITEVTNRGQLRVSGTKKLFLKTASYDLTISGVIREDDISPSRTIASSRLMESKVDVTK